MKHIAATSLAAVSLLTTTAALAQYTGPAQSPATGYTGPDTIPTMTAKQLLSDGRDDQYARLQGHIVSHDGGQDYTFADKSGRLPVEISGNRFPAGQPIDAGSRVELVVEVDKDVLKTEFEVEQIRILP